MLGSGFLDNIPLVGNLVKMTPGGQLLGMLGLGRKKRPAKRKGNRRGKK